MTLWLVFIGIAYLVGSIPFGLLIGLSRGVDIRTAGSGNVGATNLGRLLGKRFGVVCFLLDAAKGAVPVIAIGLLSGAWGRPVIAAVRGDVPLEPLEMWMWLAVAAAALLGHVLCPWLRFRGGKGVATGFGAMVAMWSPLTVITLVSLALWYATLRRFRYISLASVVAAGSLPVLNVLAALWTVVRTGGESVGPIEAIAARGPLILVTAALATLVAVRHRGNLGRIREGTEPRIGERSPEAT